MNAIVNQGSTHIAELDNKGFLANAHWIGWMKQMFEQLEQQGVIYQYPRDASFMSLHRPVFTSSLRSTSFVRIFLAIGIFHIDVEKYADAALRTLCMTTIMFRQKPSVDHLTNDEATLTPGRTLFVERPAL